MTTIKAQMGTLFFDLHLVDNEDMDRMLKSPGARAAATPIYIDHRGQMFPVPAQEVKLFEDKTEPPPCP